MQTLLKRLSILVLTCVSIASTALTDSRVIAQSNPKKRTQEQIYRDIAEKRLEFARLEKDCKDANVLATVSIFRDFQTEVEKGVNLLPLMEYSEELELEIPKVDNPGNVSESCKKIQERLKNSLNYYSILKSTLKTQRNNNNSKVIEATEPLAELMPIIYKELPITELDGKYYIIYSDFIVYMILIAGI